MATAPAKSITSQQANSSVEIVSDSLAMGIVFALALTVVGRIIGFFRGILFCRLMTDQQLGQWSLLWSFLMMLAPFAVLGLPGCFGRFVEHYRQRGQLGAFVKRIAWISGAMTLTLSASILLFPNAYSWMAFRETDHITAIRFLGLALILVSVMNFLISLLESLRQVRVVTIMRFIFGITFAAVGCSMLVVWEDGTSAATISCAIGCAVASVPAIWFLWKYRAEFTHGAERLERRVMWRRIAPFAIWLWWSNLFNNLFEVSDRYMLIHWSPETADVAQSYVGQYHCGRVVPLLLVSVATMLAGILMPYMSAAWEEGKTAKVRTQLTWAIKLVALTFTAGGLCMIFAAPLLFDWVLQGRYAGGFAVLPLTLTYCTWYSIFLIAQDYLWIREKGKQAFVIVAIALMANILLNLALIPRYELWGAVVATSIANALNLVLVLRLNHRAGCRNDVGTWVCVSLPLVLLLPPLLAIVPVALVAITALQTNWVFNENEKKQLAPIIAKAVQRMRRG